MSLKKRVQERLDALGKNPTEVSEAAGFASTFVRDILKDRKKSVRGDSLLKLAKALDCSPGWLNGETDKMVIEITDTLLSGGEELVRVPVYDIRASAGSGALVADSAPEKYRPYRLDELERFNIAHIAEIQVGGDSMWDTLHDGDTVMIDRSVTKVVKPGIYVLFFDGAVIVKRCQRHLGTGSIKVSSDNKEYEAFEVSPDDPHDLTVLGRVIKTNRWLG